MKLNRRRATLSILASFSARSFAAESAPGVTDREILIGQVAALTGPAAELGIRLRIGMQAYFSAVNAQGGVAGRRIKLVSRDDGYEPDRTAAAARALIGTDRVFALAGSVGTPTGLVLLPILEEAKVPIVGMFTGAQGLREPMNRNVFHVRATYNDETELIVAHLHDTLGLKKIAVFYQDDAYGRAGLAGVERALTKRQLKPVALGTVERNTVAVDKAIQSILPAAPDAIVQISAYKSCAALIKAARAKRYAGQFANVSFVGSKALADELGAAGRGVIVSQVVPSPFHPRSAVVAEYQQHMTQAGEKTFDFTSLEGYISARVLVEGLRRAGQALTRDGLITALETMQNYNMGGYTVDFSPTDHQGGSLTNLTIIGSDGRFLF